MTAQQIQDGNRLIAEFMGEVDDYWWERDRFNERIKAKFHSNWNELMRACKKFDSFVLDDFKVMPQWTNYKILCDNIDDAVTTYDIEKAFAALVKAITWYKHFGQ